MSQNKYNNISTTASFLGSVNEGENHRPKKPWKGETVSSIVGSGLEAIVNSFALISSISARHLSAGDALVLGFANLIGYGISSGLGEFVSCRTEKAMAAKEKLVTEWDVTNNLRPQRYKLLQQYKALGIHLNDATDVVDIFTKYDKILVHENMAAEKGILPSKESENPWKNCFITSTSFILFGSAPLLAYLILKSFTRSETYKFFGACVFSTIALGLLGIAKAKISGQGYVRSLVITILNGAIASIVAYSIGWGLRNAGLED